MILSLFRPMYYREEPLAHTLSDEFVEATGQFLALEMHIDADAVPLSVATPFALSSELDFYDACMEIEAIHKHILPELFTSNTANFCSFCSLFPEARTRPNDESLTYGFRMDTALIACLLICELFEDDVPSVFKIYAFEKKKLNEFLSATAQGVNLRIPCAKDGIVFYNGDAVHFGSSRIVFHLLPQDDDIQISLSHSHSGEIFKGTSEECEAFFNARKHLQYSSFQIETPFYSPVWSASIEKAASVMDEILNRHIYVKEIDMDNFVERVSHCFREACSMSPKVDGTLSFILPSEDDRPVFQEVTVPQRWIPTIKQYFALSDDANGILPVVENELSLEKYPNIRLSASRIFAYAAAQNAKGSTHSDAVSAVDAVLKSIQEILECPEA